MVGGPRLPSKLNALTPLAGILSGANGVEVLEMRSGRNCKDSRFGDTLPSSGCSSDWRLGDSLAGGSAVADEFEANAEVDEVGKRRGEAAIVSLSILSLLLASAGCGSEDDLGEPASITRGSSSRMEANERFGLFLVSPAEDAEVESSVGDDITGISTLFALALPISLEGRDGEL